MATISHLFQSHTRDIPNVEGTDLKSVFLISKSSAQYRNTRQSYEVVMFSVRWTYFTNRDNLSRKNSPKKYLNIYNVFVQSQEWDIDKKDKI